MRPTFRTDLVCSREEQQGVVFYRIDDPKSQTSFRLYEIEYLIAKKLDGNRELSAVTTAVKKEFNFDINEPDLQRFVNQLESMGFLVVSRDTTDRAAVAAEPETAVMDRPVRPEPAAAEPAAPLPPLELAPTDFDAAEFNRLLRSAFLHVKQGYVVHARDYFLAAKELSPSDERLTKLVHHLEIIGDASGPAEVEYLWNQATQLFPDIAAEVGPGVESRSGGPVEAVTSPAVEAPGWDEDIKARVAWLVVLLVVLIGGVGGLVWVVKTYRIFEAAPRVKVSTLRADRIPILFEAPAEAVQAVQEQWLSVGADGPVESVVAPGQRVAIGDVVLSLQLPPPVVQQLKKSKAALVKADQALAKASEKVEKLVAEREAVETERSTAEERLKELRPKSVLNQGGVSKRDLEKWKSVLVEANKKLGRIKQKERGPRKQLAKLEKRREATAKKLEQVQARAAAKLVRAPFAGLVAEAKATVGQTVKAGERLVLLRDSDAVRLRFTLPVSLPVQVGGEAHVAVRGGKPGRAKVSSLTAKEPGAVLEVRLDDPTGTYLEMPPADFQLVREFAEPAYRVPVGAVFGNERGTFVIVAMQKRAQENAVEVLHRDAAHAVIRGVAGSLRDGEQVVTVRLEGGTVSEIGAGAALEIVE